MPVLPSDLPRCRCIGIDPGASGGLASVPLLTGTRWLDDEVIAIPMPATERDLWNWFTPGGDGIMQEIDEPGSVQLFAMIELVSGYIGTEHPGSAMFKFGQSYGSLRMALIAAGVSFEEVTPQAWQKALGITPRRSHRDGKVKVWDETKSQFKTRLKAKAQQLFPSLRVTLATADALLIAEHCRRARRGMS